MSRTKYETHLDDINKHGISLPTADVDSLRESVLEIRSAIEELFRQRGEVNSSAVRVADLVKLGLISQEETNILGTAGATYTAPNIAKTSVIRGSATSVATYPFARECTSYGASPNASASVNAAAIQAALDGGPGNVHLSAGEYEVDSVVSLPSNVNFFGDGFSTHLKMAAGGSDYNSLTPIQLGNYGGEQATSGVTNEVGYSIQAANMGDRYITLTTTSEDSNFTAGAIVFMEAVDTNSTGSPRYVHGSRVQSVSSGVIYLERPLKAGFGNTSTIRVANTGNVTALDGQPGWISENSSLHDMRISHADGQVDWQVIHLSCYESQLYNLYLTGGSVIAGNPVCYTDFHSIYIVGLRKLIELAYYSIGCQFNHIQAVRPGGDASGVNFGFDLNQSGGWHTLDNVIVDNGDSTSDALRITEQHGIKVTNSTFKAGDNTGSYACNLENDCEDVELYNNTFIAEDTHCIRIDDAVRPIIKHNHTKNTPVGSYSVFISGNASGCIVEDNELDDGSHEGHIVYCGDFADNDGHRIRRNHGYIPELYTDYGTQQHTGTTNATTLSSQPLPIGAVGNNSRIRFKAWGTVTGFNGTKIIEVKIGGTTVAAVGGEASWAAGEGWELDGVVMFDSATTQQTSAWGYEQITPAPNEVLGVSWRRTSTAVESNNTACDVELVATLGNANDSVVVRGVEFEVLQR